MLCLVGAYSLNNSQLDLWILVGFGIFGYGLRKLAIDSSPLVVALVLGPLMEKIGVDPIHFGVIMVINLCIGLLTPPVGIIVFILGRIAGISFERATKAVLPFMALYRSTLS